MSKNNEIYAFESRRKYLEVYAYLLSKPFETDITKDKEYQRKFVSFFRFKRSKEFLEFYFNYLQNNINNNDLTVGDIVRVIYDKTNRFEDCLASYLYSMILPRGLFITPILKNKNIEGLDFSYDNKELALEEKCNQINNNINKLDEYTKNLYELRFNYMLELMPKYSDYDSVIEMATLYFLYFNNNTKEKVKDKTIYDKINYTDNKQIEYIKIPKGIRIIPRKSFYGCEKLKEVIFNGHEKKICGRAFNNCFSLDNVILPKTIEFIGPFAFYKCTSLTNIKLPYGIKYIHTASFFKTKLKEIYIPETIETISNEVFAECKDLKDIYYKGEKEQFKKITDKEFTNMENITIHCIDGNILSKDIIEKGELIWK